MASHSMIKSEERTGLLRNTKILIVEDIDSMRYLLQYTLERIVGLSVSGLASGVAEARRSAMRERPDLVLLDEILPGESSYDFLKELVEQKLPVVLLTGIEKPEHALPAGALGRIVKPNGRSLEKDVDRLQKSLRLLAPMLFEG